MRLIIWTGKAFVEDRRSKTRVPGSFDDHYYGMVCRAMRRSEEKPKVMAGGCLVRCI